MTTAWAAFVLAVWVVTGMVLGFLGSGWGVCRLHCRLWPGVRHALDWLFYSATGLIALGVLFWTDRGRVRVGVVVGLLAGIGVWRWLGAPVGDRVMAAMVRRLERGCGAVGRVGRLLYRRPPPNIPPRN